MNLTVQIGLVTGALMLVASGCCTTGCGFAQEDAAVRGQSPEIQHATGLISEPESLHIQQVGGRHQHLAEVRGTEMMSAGTPTVRQADARPSITRQAAIAPLTARRVITDYSEKATATVAEAVVMVDVLSTTRLTRSNVRMICDTQCRINRVER